VEVGLVQGTHFSVDGSFVEANAAKGSRIPREQLVEVAEVYHTVRQSKGRGRAKPGGRSHTAAGSGVDHRSGWGSMFQEKFGDTVNN